MNQVTEHEDCDDNYRVCSVTGEMMHQGWYFEGTGKYFKYQVDVVAELRPVLDELTVEFLEGDEDDEELLERIAKGKCTEDDILKMAHDCEWMYWTDWYEGSEDE